MIFNLNKLFSIKLWILILFSGSIIFLSFLLGSSRSVRAASYNFDSVTSAGITCTGAEADWVRVKVNLKDANTGNPISGTYTATCQYDFTSGGNYYESPDTNHSVARYGARCSSNTNKSSGTEVCMGACTLPFNLSAKASGYADTPVWKVNHEIGINNTLYGNNGNSNTANYTVYLDPVAPPPPSPAPTDAPDPPGQVRYRARVFMDHNANGVYDTGVDRYFGSRNINAPDFSSSIARVYEWVGGTLTEITNDFGSAAFYRGTAVANTSIYLRIIPQGDWSKTSYNSFRDIASPSFCAANTSCPYDGNGYTGRLDMVDDGGRHIFKLGIVAPPFTPTAFTAQTWCDSDGSGVDLEWTPIQAATSYNIYRWNVPIGSGWTVFGSTSNSSIGFYPIDTSSGYTMHVKAVNANGESFASNQVDFQAPDCPPYPPPSFTATPSCSGATSQASLSWGSVVGATSYNIYRWNKPTSSIWNLLTTSTGTSKTISPLTQGDGYSLDITAVNAEGESFFGTPSNQEDFTASTCVVTYTLTVNKNGTGTGTVTSSPAGINCGATCSSSYSSGTSVTLTATPDAGSIVGGWSGGGCSGTSTTCVVTMDAAKTVTVTFGISTYSISGTIFEDDGVGGGIADNGVRDGGEGFYTGSTIPISVNDGGASSRTLTNGVYTITGFLGSTSNTLKITPPAGYSLTNGGAGANPNSNPRSVTVVTSDVVNINFGIVLTPTYTISGNVYVDTNSNGIKDGAETNWTGAITIGSTGGSVSYPGSGQFTVSNVSSGTYTISYTSGPPAGYSVGSPTNGPPPFYSVTVGPDKTDINFGIVSYGPWIQTDGGDTRFDNGVTNLIPPSPTCLGGANFSTNSTGGGPGIVFGGGSSPNLGDGAPSVNGWVIWDSTSPPVYTPSKGVLSTSYDFVDARMKQAGTTVTTVSSISSATATGNYKVNGNLTISTGITIPGNVQIVVLVPGNLIIQGNISILVATTSTLTFIVKGDITVDARVGESLYSSTAPNLEGYYSTDKSFIVQDRNTCPIADKKLNISGSVVVNAARKGGSFINNRSLCTDNNLCPVVTVKFRPDFIINAPESIKRDSTVYQEIAP